MAERMHCEKTGREEEVCPAYANAKVTGREVGGVVRGGIDPWIEGSKTVYDIASEFTEACEFCFFKRTYDKGRTRIKEREEREKY